MGQGDIQAQFLKYGREIRIFLSRRISCSETAADLAQETFVRLVRVSAYETIDDVRAWLYRTASNLAIDHHRSRQPAGVQTTSLEEMEPTLEDRSGSEISLERKELMDLVQEKLRQLPLPQRETFLLFRYHDMSYQEIAEIQGVSVRTVDSRLYRAMKWLGQHLNGHFKSESEG